MERALNPCQVPKGRSPFSALQEFAFRSGAAIVAANHWDPNVPGEPFTKALRGTIDKRKVEVLANETFLSIMLKDDFANVGGLAINGTDRVLFLSRLGRPITVQGSEYATFTRDGLFSSEQNQFLQSVGLRNFLEQT